MRRISFCLLVILCLTISFFIMSCKEENDNQFFFSTGQLSEEELIIKDKLDNVAVIVCGILEDKSDCDEVKYGVDANIMYGLDEELRFVDLLSPQKSKILDNSSKNSSFSKRLALAFDEAKTKSDDTYDLETFVLNDNVQIYWPYSENWDGTEMPTVTFNPLLPIDENIGYKKVFLDNGDYRIDKIVVDEEYCVNHPVWIINQNETDYDDIPSFVDDEYKKGDVIYLQQSFDTKSETLSYLNDSSKIYEIQIGEVRCTKQYDIIWNGGADLYFKMIGTRQTGEKFAEVDYNNGSLSAKLKRSDIRKKKWIQYYSAVNVDWSPNELENGFLLYENDGGNKEKSFDGNLTFQISKLKISCEFSFPYGKRDEVIYQMIWDRCAFFSGNKGENDPNVTLNNNWRVYKAGNVEWTMPYVVRDKAY